MLNDTIFTFKSLTDTANNDPNATPGMVSQATSFINNTLGAMKMSLVGGFKKLISPSTSSHKEITDTHQDELPNNSMSECDINTQVEQAEIEIDRLRSRYEAELKMKEEKFSARIQRQQAQLSQHYQNSETQLQEQLQTQLQMKDFYMKTNYQAKQGQIAELQLQIAELTKRNSQNSCFANVSQQVATVPNCGQVSQPTPNAPNKNANHLQMANSNNTFGAQKAEHWAAINRIENCINFNNFLLQENSVSVVQQHVMVKIIWHSKIGLLVCVDSQL